VRLPSGSTRSFRNQLVRLDLCSFISSSVHPFCNLLMLGTEQNEKFGSAVAAAAAAIDVINGEKQVQEEEGVLNLKTSKCLSLYCFVVTFLFFGGIKS
jgi:hypothetical protein